MVNYDYIDCLVELRKGLINSHYKQNFYEKENFKSKICIFRNMMELHLRSKCLFLYII